MKAILAKHGGVAASGFTPGLKYAFCCQSRVPVSHVVRALWGAQSTRTALPDKLRVVTVEWLVDSARQRKKLDWKQYVVAVVSEAAPRPESAQQRGEPGPAPQMELATAWHADGALLEVTLGLPQTGAGDPVTVAAFDMDGTLIHTK